MSAKDPLDRPKSDFKEILAKLHSDNSPVGIDAQYTHAVIIGYLQDIVERLERLEQKLDKPGAPLM